MIAVTVEFEIKPEHLAPFRAAVLRQASNSLSAEPACRQFDVCTDATTPTQFFLYELYDDRAAFEDHLVTEHFRQFNQDIADWTVRKIVRIWDVIS